MGIRVGGFRALRFATESVGELSAVLAPPYDVIGPEEALELRRRHPRNIVHLTNPPGDGESRYAEAARLLESWVADGSLLREDRPAVYLHRHGFSIGGEPRSRRGLWATLKLEPLGASILPHERTMGGPKADRLALMRACRTQLSPIFVICTDPNGRFAALLEEIMEDESAERATFPAGESHEIWRETGEERIAAIRDALDAQVCLIADGHHRYETALAYRESMAASGATDDGAPYEHVMVHIVSERDPGLIIWPTHRVVTGSGIDWRAAVNRAEERFDVQDLESIDPGSAVDLLEARRGDPAFVLVAAGGGDAWLLSLRDRSSTPFASVALHEVFLERDAGVSPDGQSRSVSYVRDAEEALTRLRTGASDAAVLVTAPTVEQVRDTAAGGRRLPPKTTYFWPKVPTGIALHSLEGENIAP